MAHPDLLEAGERGYQQILTPGKGYVCGWWGVGRAELAGAGACTAANGGVMQTHYWLCAVSINHLGSVYSTHLRSSTVATPASQPACQPASPSFVCSSPPLSPLVVRRERFPWSTAEGMTTDETDRLQALRAEGSDVDKIKVSPRKGSALLPLLAPSRALGRSGRG